MKSPLNRNHPIPPTLIPFPSPLFTSNHYQEFGLFLPIHFKNILKTYIHICIHYQYIVLNFVRKVLIKIYKCHCNMCYSAFHFSFNKIFEIILCNTCRYHLLNFTDIQYFIISILHFVPNGHLSCFQLMATTNHATVNRLVYIS